MSTTYSQQSEVPAAVTVEGIRQASISVVIPTKNEALNLPLLMDRLDRVVPDLEMEVIFVDDSDDDTPEVIERLTSSRPVRSIHRPPAERSGGLGSAVVAGIRAARAPFICVMDADLQHPPEVLERLFLRAEESGADLVVASRFCDEGGPGSFGRLRRALSRASAIAASVLFPSRLREVTDPMSGCFLARRSAIDVDSLRPNGFKILLEILVRAPGLTVTEVPYVFGERHAGETKASGREALRYLGQLWRLRFRDLSLRFGRFGLVGISGLVVNTLVLLLLADFAGLYYVLAAVVATQVSTLWNFTFTELWVFSKRRHERSVGRRLVLFALLNNAALPLRIPILLVLTGTLGIHYAISNLASLAALTLLRYAVADGWIWAGSREREDQLHGYDVHGILSVSSDVRLPELARFATAEPITDPTISVRIGKMNAPVWSGSRLTPGVERSLHTGNGDGGNGRAAGAAAVVAGKGALGAALADNGDPAGTQRVNGTLPAANGSEKAAVSEHIGYSEALGRLGFAVEITAGEQIEVVASPILRHSPHVLYTNVVEPILRWNMVTRGYALVHAACLSNGGQAFLITARTDTGKTTTILKTLDHHPYSFLSDDLTILRRDGRVLSYPKPLTISRHTVQAVSAPLLSRLERLALIVQSRLHSKTGRRFALLIAKLRIPAASLNAVTQLLIPPPKYDISRLVPSAEIASESSLAGMVVIQRGENGEAKLPEDEALDILLTNCEDAYGFPPYGEIENFLHSREDESLRTAERQIIRGALSSLPATLVKRESRDWWKRLPGLMEEAKSHVPVRQWAHEVDEAIADLASGRSSDLRGGRAP